MHDILKIDRIKSRCKQIGLHPSHLARLANVHRTTVERSFQGKIDPSLSTFRKLVEALLAEELRLFEHLLMQQPFHICPNCDEILTPNSNLSGSHNQNRTLNDSEAQDFDHQAKSARENETISQANDIKREEAA